MNKRSVFTFFSLALAVSLSACNTNPPIAKAPPKEQIDFIDYQGFDDELSSSFAAELPKVDIAFFDNVTPNALPTRLQTWMASVESGGGKVKVTPPPSTSNVRTRNPLMLISLVSTLWTAGGVASEMSKSVQFRTAKSYDAEIKLKTNDKGQSVVDKVIFTQRKP